MGPKEVVQGWVDAFNKADVDQVVSFYSDDAINHQVANDKLVGKEAIRARFEEEFSAAEMVCIVEHLFQDGDWAILEWKDPLGLRGCGFFHIQKGKIVFQRGYWDKLSFLKQHGLPIPQE
ncbi:steroid delta-isomerase [Microbulbifer sp. A4B17]|uniref:nuclear transport factor 2 family protein n=1 Tax=Microbulbifer sp. A4B17 TaxID=359370 RepID=UPI000D52A8E2|nr:ester cyclase [Microbulbifer sp. A4B17]AWF81663.1 steroid delta-isomerase [Microbulbifer sp. A4B17]